MWSYLETKQSGDQMHFKKNISQRFSVCFKCMLPIDNILSSLSTLCDHTSTK